MKRFIINVFIFSIPIVLMALALDVLISYYLKQSKTYASGEYSTWNDVYTGDIKAEIVIYGSSRAFVQIDPEIIQKGLGKTCYNLGMDGNNIWPQYFRHTELLKLNEKPRLIIHSLDMFMLSADTVMFNREQFLPYMFWNKDIEKLCVQNRSYSYLDFHLPLMRYYGHQAALLHSLKLLLKPEQESIGRIHGYEGQALRWNTDLENAKLKMGTFEAPIDSNSIQLFEKYLKECQNASIQLVFVYTPEYIEGQHFVKNRKVILDRYREISKQYSIPYFDYSSDSISFDKANFYNSGHLNKRGSKLFTQKLVNDLKATKEWPRYFNSDHSF